MTFEKRNRPKALADLVFADPAVEQAILDRSQPDTADNLLLWGPGGTGKSATCQVLAEVLVGPNHLTDINKINVSRHSTKAALCEMIESKAWYVTMNPMGKVVFILEELDGADKAAQEALKGVMDDLHTVALFLATTNNLGGINGPLRSRFVALNLGYPSPQQWAARGTAILKSELVKSTVPMTAHLLETEASSGTVRDMMRVLRTFAERVRQANAAPPKECVVGGAK